MSRLAVWLILALALQAPGRDVSPLVDHHQHLFDAASASLAPGIEQIDAARLVALLDDAGIRRAVVLSVAYQFGNPNKPAVPDEYARVRAENDWTSAQVARFPDRLVGFCSVDPLKAYALAEIDRCARDRWLRTGLKVHFGNSDVNLDDHAEVDKVRRVFRAADARGMAIVVHMRASVTRKRPYGANEARVFLNELLPAAPHATVQIAHLTGAGGYDDPGAEAALAVFIDAIANADPRMAHVYFDVSGIAGFGHWKDKAELIATRIRQVGIERILYGSDAATGGGLPPRDAWAAFRQLPLTDAEIDAIAANVAPYLR